MVKYLQQHGWLPVSRNCPYCKESMSLVVDGNCTDGCVSHFMFFSLNFINSSMFNSICFRTNQSRIKHDNDVWLANGTLVNWSSFGQQVCLYIQDTLEPLGGKEKLVKN